jgi:hypothetical protein
MVARGATAGGAGLAAAALALAIAAAGPGCSFPAVTFDPQPDASGAAALTDDAGASDATASSGDDGDTIDGAAATTQDATTQDAGTVNTPGFDGGCDFNGVWATQIKIDVTWQPQGLMSVILASGSGTITQWVKGLRVQTAAAPLQLSDDSVVCGIDLPDFQATALGLNEVYGVRFPDSLFDDGYIPPFTVNGALTLQPGGTFTYSSTPTAVLLGLTMADPTTDPWPATVTTEVDQDMDGNPGVTIAVAQGPLATPTATATDYSYIPTGIPELLMPINVASSLYVAIRQVTVTSGTVQNCNTITGTVSIPTIDSKAAIDSHVLGCELVDGGQCTTGASSEAAFVDNSQPVFTPSGTTSFQAIRMPAGSTCADVRTMLP